MMRKVTFRYGSVPPKIDFPIRNSTLGLVLQLVLDLAVEEYTQIPPRRGDLVVSVPKNRTSRIVSLWGMSASALCSDLGIPLSLVL